MELVQIKMSFSERNWKPVGFVQKDKKKQKERDEQEKVEKEKKAKEEQERKEKEEREKKEAEAKQLADQEAAAQALENNQVTENIAPAPLLSQM